jgi:hypothetical protein
MPAAAPADLQTKMHQLVQLTVDAFHAPDTVSIARVKVAA